MSRLHDMGGRFGDGLIPVPRDGKNEVTNLEPTFKYEWHAKAWAITLAAGALGEWNLDISRHYRECLPPKDYVNFSYRTSLIFLMLVIGGCFKRNLKR